MAASLTPAVASASPSQLTFQFRTFDVPGSTGTEVNGINNSGVFVGAFTDAAGQHGFIDRDGRLVPFDFPGTSGVTQAFAIDNNGDVVGTYNNAAGASEEFLRTSNGRMTALPSPPGAGTGSGQGAFPSGITDTDEIVGYYIDANGVFHGYEQSPSGHFTAIAAPGAGSATGEGTLVFGVSDAGTISGCYFTSEHQEIGFVDRAGRFTSVDNPATPQNPAGGTIVIGPARGVTIGDYANQQGTALGYVLSGGQFTTIDDAQGVAPFGTTIVGLNRDLVLVGFFTSSDGAFHGFIAFPRR
jgi:hypothetical protein